MISKRIGLLLLIMTPLALICGIFFIWQTGVFTKEETKIVLSDKEMFEHAQAYKVLKKYDEAIKHYTDRIARGGNAEEVWCSKYMLGNCYATLKQWPKAREWYLKAYESNPQRAEPLIRLSSHYREKAENNLAHLFAKQSLEIPQPPKDSLLVDQPIYDFERDTELAISSFYTPYREDGFAAINRLMLKKNIPQYVKTHAGNSALYYVTNIKNEGIFPIKIELPLMKEGRTERYFPSNTSILKTKSGYSMICRTVNYSNDGKSFAWLDPSDQIWRTRNYFVNMDKDFNVISQREIIENLARTRVKRMRAEGLEDGRIFEYKNALWFTCSTTDTNLDGPHQISACRLQKGDDKTVQVSKLLPLKGPDPKRIEKNWLPFVRDGKFYAIYGYDPFLVFKPNLETGACKACVKYEAPLDFSRFRGSAGPVEFDNGYLLLVHEVIFKDKNHYLHRFVFTDKDFKVTMISKPFIFQSLGVEFCCGMTLDHAEEKLVMPITKEDKDASIMLLNLSTVWDMLEPLPKSSTSQKKKKKSS